MSARPTHVWLRLYQLNEALEATGATTAQQVKTIVEDLQAMPPELQQQSLRRLERLGDLVAEVAAACKVQSDPTS